MLSDDNDDDVAAALIIAYSRERRQLKRRKNQAIRVFDIIKSQEGSTSQCSSLLSHNNSLATLLLLTCDIHLMYLELTCDQLVIHSRPFCDPFVAASLLLICNFVHMKH